MNDIILETKDLCKTFQKQKVVQDICISVPANSIYGLLGPNGAGKSTTLKMITGILKPASGEIYFKGHKWAREDLHSIGSLIESASLYENLTARENLKVRTVTLGLPDSRIDLEFNSQSAGVYTSAVYCFPFSISIICSFAVEQEALAVNYLNLEWMQ